FVLDVEPGNQYKFSFVNQAFLEVTGLSGEMVVGHYVTEVIPEPSLSLVLSKYQEAIREKKQVFWEETSDYPTGRKIGEVNVSPVFDEQGRAIRLVGAVHDLTKWKQAEAALAKSQQIYKSLFDYHPDAV